MSEEAGKHRPARKERPELTLWVKLAWTGFTVMLVPVYWRAYGPGNFLWFSNVAVFGIVAALWLESALIASMMAVSVLLLEIGWAADFLAGGRLIGLTSYMFDENLPLWLRAISCFHLAIPPTLLWLLHKLGYDRRALAAQTVLAWVVLPATFLLTDPAENINWVFGLGEEGRLLLPLELHFVLQLAVFPLAIYLPSHLLLTRLFPRGPTGDR